MKILALLVLFAFSTSYQAGSSDIKLIINEIQTDTGTIRVLVFNQADGFPEEPKKAFKALSIPVKNLKAETVIKGLPAGNYAISVFHDENDDGELKKNIVGIPIENYGFSNNPSVIFSAPSFNKCSFRVDNSAASTLSITLK